MEAAREGGLENAWRLLARPDQQWPGYRPWYAADDDNITLSSNDRETDEKGATWTTWLLLGGRGAGKTRAGAEWIRHIVGLGPSHCPPHCINKDRPHSHANIAANDNTPPKRIALVAEAYADAREVMIEGPSGLRNIGHPALRPTYESSRRRLVWPNGAVGYCFSAEDPDGLRGYQFDAAWSDELAKWRYPEETWSNLQLALRLGNCPQQVVTTTPRPIPLLKKLLQKETTVTSRASTYANRENLADAFFSQIIESYKGTALGRQEIEGELIEDVSGALWTWAMIEAARIERDAVRPADLDRIVVAVDPPASAGPDADECGIIVAGITHQYGTDGRPLGIVLADWSVSGQSPRGWAERAVAALHEFDADRIVAEVNQGGDMVRAIIEQVDPSAPVRAVRAMRGKTLRAEPIAALYEQARVKHAGRFSTLEDQMTSYTGASNQDSPDRLDALVWALTDLCLSRPTKPSVRRLS
ncbi:MAG: terminase family protein [Pseudomonadota bacterium]